MGTASGTSAAGTTGSKTSMILMMVLVIGFSYFAMIRPNKKKQKDEQTLRDNVQVGDEITTIGGIVGRVVTVKDDTLIVETGADRNKIKIERWAIRTNNTANEKIEAERQAAKDAQEAEKQARMEESRDRSTSSRKKSKKNREDDLGGSDE